MSTDPYARCAGCQFGPTPDYPKGSKEDDRANSIARSLYAGDTLQCHRLEPTDAHFDPHQTVPTRECGGASRIRDARGRK